MAALILAACGGAEPTPIVVPTPRPTATTTGAKARVIVAMGDSLTEGLGVAMDQAYPAQLERQLQADGYNFSVINAGFSGETSSGARQRFEFVLKLKPEIVILGTGGNDSLRGIDPALTQENITQLVRAFKAKHVVVVLAGMQTVQNMGTDYTQKFQAIYPAVAKAENVILIPFFLEGVPDDPKLMQDDFIHPKPEGYTIVVKNMYPYVLQAIKALPSQ
ncbi:MAG: arylesterase [Chloroflexi bacterium]|nr:arylesterase [Chloroflexota bacterium]